MLRTKYPIHPDFKKWSWINPPIVKPLLPFIQGMLRLLRLGQRSDGRLKVTSVSIPAGDNHAIHALWYEPEGLTQSAPCLIYYHGGGYVFPAAPYHYRLLREYALRARCKALFVDYRLAPKHPYPAAPKDCCAAYRWVVANAKALSIDESRIAVAGDSAGGELAAIVCVTVKKLGETMPCAQMLLYPVTGVKPTTESMRKYTDTPLCNSRDMQKYSRLYRPHPDMGSPEYASPAQAESLAQMPTAYIESAEYDCLRDDAIVYAQRLQAASVDVELNNTEGTIHGFDIVKNSEIVHECVRRRVAFLRRVFLR